MFSIANNLFVGVQEFFGALMEKLWEVGEGAAMAGPLLPFILLLLALWNPKLVAGSCRGHGKFVRLSVNLVLLWFCADYVSFTCAQRYLVVPVDRYYEEGCSWSLMGKGGLCPNVDLTNVGCLPVRLAGAAFTAYIEEAGDSNVMKHIMWAFGNVRWFLLGTAYMHERLLDLCVLLVASVGMSLVVAPLLLLLTVSVTAIGNGSVPLSRSCRKLWSWVRRVVSVLLVPCVGVTEALKKTRAARRRVLLMPVDDLRLLGFKRAELYEREKVLSVLTSQFRYPQVNMQGFCPNAVYESRFFTARLIREYRPTDYEKSLLTSAIRLIERDTGANLLHHVAQYLAPRKTVGAADHVAFSFAVVNANMLEELLNVLLSEAFLSVRCLPPDDYVYQAHNTRGSLKLASVFRSAGGDPVKGNASKAERECSPEQFVLEGAVGNESRVGAVDLFRERRVTARCAPEPGAGGVTSETDTGRGLPIVAAVPTCPKPVTKVADATRVLKVEGVGGAAIAADSGSVMIGAASEGGVVVPVGSCFGYKVKFPPKTCSYVCATLVGRGEGLHAGVTEEEMQATRQANKLKMARMVEFQASKIDETRGSTGLEGITDLERGLGRRSRDQQMSVGAKAALLRKTHLQLQNLDRAVLAWGKAQRAGRAAITNETFEAYKVLILQWLDWGLDAASEEVVAVAASVGVQRVLGLEAALLPVREVGSAILARPDIAAVQRALETDIVQLRSELVSSMGAIMALLQAKTAENPPARVVSIAESGDMGVVSCIGNAAKELKATKAKRRRALKQAATAATPDGPVTEVGGKPDVALLGVGDASRLEGPVLGRPPLRYQNTACFVSSLSGPMQGYLIKAGAGTVHFVTRRHARFGGVAVLLDTLVSNLDGQLHMYVDNQVAAVRLHNNGGKIYYKEDPDKVAFVVLLPTAIGEKPQPFVWEPAVKTSLSDVWKTEDGMVGLLLRAQCLHAKAGGGYEWVEHAGEANLQAGDRTVSINTSTAAGCCRATYYDWAGKIFAGHRYERMADGRPGADIELCLLPNAKADEVLFHQDSFNQPLQSIGEGLAIRAGDLRPVLSVADTVQRMLGTVTPLAVDYLAVRFSMSEDRVVDEINSSPFLNFDMDGNVVLVDYDEDCVRCAAVYAARLMLIHNYPDDESLLAQLLSMAVPCTVHHGDPTESELLFMSGRLLVNATGLQGPLLDGGRHAKTFVLEDKYPYVLPTVHAVSSLVDAKYSYMKPGLSLCKAEVAKFGNDVKYAPDRAVMSEIWSYVLQQDLVTCVSYVGDFSDDRVGVVVDELMTSGGDACLGGKSPMAGESMPGKTHRDFFERLAAETGLSPRAAGIVYLRNFVVELERFYTNGEKPQDYTDSVRNFHTWRVQGKADRYDWEKKLSKGDARSIQAPSVEMKFLWLYCMGQSDARWQEIDCYRTGYNLDGEVPKKVSNVMRNARCVAATDMKGFDRDMAEELMYPFFKYYVGTLCCGMPEYLTDAFYQSTCHSTLVFSDGTSVVKDHGNPSGFPNTLRLNSVVLRVCDLAVASTITGLHPRQYEDSRYGEYCGDDSRVWLLKEDNTPESQRYADLLDLTVGDHAIEVWAQLFGWEVKNEGLYKARGEVLTNQELLQLPLFISRGCMNYKGQYVTPLVRPDRVVSKLLFQRPNPGVKIMGVAACLAPLVRLHFDGQVYVPAIDALVALYPSEDVMGALEDAYVLGASYCVRRVLEGKKQKGKAPLRGRSRNFARDEDYAKQKELLVAGLYQEAAAHRLDLAFGGVYADDDTDRLHAAADAADRVKWEQDIDIEQDMRVVDRAGRGLGRDDFEEVMDFSVSLKDWCNENASGRWADRTERRRQ